VGRVVRRRPETEARPDGGGVEGFDTEAAHSLNKARLEHLASLGLPLAGRRVLEVGAGVGRLTSFFLEQRCEVVATEVREENLDELRRRLPSVDARRADIEESLDFLGRFDVVFCYGVLYHVENPILALRRMESVCDDLLLLETMICDSTEPVLRLEDETGSATQALRGIAHRPSTSYLALALNRVGFQHVYAADRPTHQDYRFEELNDLATSRNGSLLRGVFVASRHPMDIPRLTPLLDD